jgi:hypothetical protein
VDTDQLVEVCTLHFRNKALAGRGYVVVCVPYYEWCQMPSFKARREYVQQLLTRALLAHQQAHEQQQAVAGGKSQGRSRGVGRAV